MNSKEIAYKNFQIIHTYIGKEESEKTRIIKVKDKHQDAQNTQLIFFRGFYFPLQNVDVVDIKHINNLSMHLCHFYIYRLIFHWQASTLIQIKRIGIIPGSSLRRQIACLFVLIGITLSKYGPSY